MTRETKPTNPKDAIGSTKVPMDLVPETAVAEMATAFLEGALKYGRFNWRVMGVRASIYYSAMRRHMAKWYNGQDEDEATRVHHLASVMACCAIIIDASVRGKLNDDRPPMSPVAEHIDALADKVKHLQDLFKEHNPHQYTIADSEEEDEVEAPCPLTWDEIWEEVEESGVFDRDNRPVFVIKDEKPSQVFQDFIDKLRKLNRRGRNGSTE